MDRIANAFGRKMSRLIHSNSDSVLLAPRSNSELTQYFQNQYYNEVLRKQKNLQKKQEMARLKKEVALEAAEKAKRRHKKKR